MKFYDRVVWLVVGVLMLATAFVVSAGEVVLDVDYGVPLVCNDGVFEGEVIGGVPGDPGLPVYRYTLLLRPEAVLESVVGRLGDVDEVVLDGAFDVEPVGPVFVDGRSVWEDGVVIEDGRNVAVYNADAFFPADNVRVVSVGKMWDYKLVEVEVYPYRYNPVTKIIKKIVGARLIMEHEDERKLRDGALVPQRVMGGVKGLALNYDAVAPTYGSMPLRASTYLIMTSAAVKSSSSQLQNFIDSKIRKGFTVKIITESDWGGGTGTTAALNMRSWLASNYQSLGIEHVLIIGNPSSTTGVPMLETNPDSDYRPMTDYCYADISGNWDINGNGVYAEFKGDYTAGGADKYAELNVGRIPYYGNMQELDMILKKITDYENEPKENTGWRKEVFLPLDPFDGYQNGFVFGEAIKRDILVPAGYGCFRVYEDHFGVGAEKYPCNYENVLSSWNAGNYGLVIWQAHGQVTFAQDVMNTANAAQLKSDHPSHVYQTSCHNGRPQAPNNLAYSVLKTAAVSTIASAVEIIYNLSTDYGNKGGGNDFGYVYAKCLINDKLPAAAAFNKTRSEIPITWGTAWLNCVELNLYGCPAVGLFSYADGTVVTPTPTVTVTPTPTVTPTATPTPPMLTKVSVDGLAIASSSYTTGFGPANANDDNENTVWGAALSDKKPYLYIDLGKQYTVKKIVVKWFDGYFASRYYLGAMIGGTWAVQYATGDGGEDVYELAGDDIITRYVGLQCLSGPLNAYGIRELEVWAK